MKNGRDILGGPLGLGGIEDAIQVSGAIGPSRHGAAFGASFNKAILLTVCAGDTGLASFRRQSISAFSDRWAFGIYSFSREMLD